METNIIFIDFVQYIDDNLLKPNTEIIVMVGLNQNDISIKFVKKNIDNVSSIKLIKVKAQGKNALDFFITYYLGVYIRKDRNINFIVISNDGGYDALIKHLSENEISIKRIEYKKNNTILDKKDNSTIEDETEIENGIDNKCETVLDQIKKEKGPKPSTLKGLKKRIKKIFTNNITDDNVLKIIDLMKNNKNIEINNENVIDLFNNPKDATVIAWEAGKRSRMTKRFFLNGCTG
jgi:hypothetical protein